MRMTFLDKKMPMLIVLIAVWLLYIFAQFQFVEWVINETGHIRMHEWVSHLSAVQIFILTVFCYPVIEELIFRLSLRATSPNLFVSLLVVIWFILFQNELDTFSIEKGTGFAFRMVGGVALSLVIVWLFENKHLDRVARRLAGIDMWYVIIISAFIFALMHLSKIDYDNWMFATIFIVLIYFTHGVFFGFVRMKINIWVALLFHIATNSIPYILILYFSITQEENLFKYL